MGSHPNRHGYRLGDDQRRGLYFPCFKNRRFTLDRRTERIQSCSGGPSIWWTRDNGTGQELGQSICRLGKLGGPKKGRDLVVFSGISVQKERTDPIAMDLRSAGGGNRPKMHRDGRARW